MPFPERDQVRTILGKLRQRLGLESAIAAIIDDDAEPRGATDRCDMCTQSGLRRFHQIRRQQQDAVGADLLGLLGVGYGHARAVSGSAYNRHLAAAALHATAR